MTPKKPSKDTPTPSGYLALVLHAHLPFVRHPEHERFLEEDWLFEAITETYLPLLEIMEGWTKDAMDWRLTMSLTPSLCSMLLDPLLQERYNKHLRNLIELSEKEVQRTGAHPELNKLAVYYLDSFKKCQHYYNEVYHQNIPGAFNKFQIAGNLEIITCSATHGFMPLMQHHPAAVRAQVRTGVEHYQKTFGRSPRGTWNAECGFFPGLDKVLADHGIEYFFADSHALILGEHLPKYGVFAPIETPAGPLAFGRDQESSRSVWSAQNGYPGDPSYREFYRDIGFDLDLDYLRPHMHSGDQRSALGIKYHKITGQETPLPEKHLYNPWEARETADRHAGHFMFCRQQQVLHLNTLMEERPPLIVSPYDAELFGHWWYEGPQFLDFLVRKLYFDQTDIRLTNAAEYMALYPENQVSMPSVSSWGFGGFSEVWLEGSNDWIYRHLDQIAVRMTALANQFPTASGLQLRALNQCAREVLLAQSSDWAFIMKTNTVVDYAVKRIKTHVLQFHKLDEMLTKNTLDEEYLKSLEWRDNLFREIDYRVYQDK
ncbi:MAG: glycoside hydrolase family 57 protein [Sumerlaeia bacterium]